MNVVTTPNPRAAPSQKPEAPRSLPSRTADAVGIGSATVSLLFALATLDTWLEKTIGVVCGLAIGALVWRAAHDYARDRLSRPMIIHLVLVACTILPLLTLLDGRGATGTAQTESANKVAGTTAGGSTAPPRETASASPPSTWPVYLNTKSVFKGNLDWASEARSIGGKKYEHSLVGCAKTKCCSGATSTIEFHLDRKYHNFKATIGIDDNEQSSAASFSISLDYQPWRSTDTLTHGQSQIIQIPSEGFQDIQLKVTRLVIRKRVVMPYPFYSPRGGSRCATTRSK